MPRIGQLRERVTIQSLTESGSGTDVSVSWDTWASLPSGCWAQVVPLSATERMQAQALNSNAAYRVIVRYVSGLTPAMRAVWDSKTLQIHGVTKINGRDEFLELACGEIA